MRVLINLRDAVVDRYLTLLGVEGSPAGLSGLSEIVRKHLARVPFENVSKLRLFAREGAGRPLTLQEFLDGIEHHDFGGTCYSSNPFLAELLQALGYDAALMGADMANANVHTCIRVRVNGREHHVDVGYAGPFFNPIPLDDLPHHINFGGKRYVFDRVPGGHEMVIYEGDERVHSYLVHQPPRPASFFYPIVAESFEPGMTFMRCLRITRFFESGEALELRNRRLIHLSNSQPVERQVDSLEELTTVVRSEFMMPRCGVEQAIDVLERLNGKSFFGEERWADSTYAPSTRT